jgi:hypothetical protein
VRHGDDRPTEAPALLARRAFLRTAAALGALAPLAGCRTRLLATGSPAAARPEPALGPEYLERGLLELGAAHPRGWLAGHGGAAILAATFFAADNALDERTGRALRANVDGFMGQEPGRPAAVAAGEGTGDAAPILEQLDGQVGALRAGGHDVIYGALALRALRERPDLATPSVVEGVRRLLARVRDDRRPDADTAHNRAHPLPEYRTAADVATTTLRATLQPWNHLRLIGTSGVLHWITHADAVLTLADLGHVDLARKAHDALRLHVNGRAPAPDTVTPPRGAPLDWLGPEYWESDRPKRAFQGTWLAGHSFKLPHGLFRLLRHVEDADLRAAALRRAALLLVPFEG